MKRKQPSVTSPSRREFLAAAAGLAAGTALLEPAVAASPASPVQTFRLRPGSHDDGFDPWIEILADAFRHNVREATRLAGGRPMLAVIKNNAYGLGDQLIGPLVASRDEVAGLACTRTSEAVAMRDAGVDGDAGRTEVGAHRRHLHDVLTRS